MKAQINLKPYVKGFSIHIGSLKHALNSNYVTLRPLFLASIAYWLFISGITLDAMQK